MRKTARFLALGVLLCFVLALSGCMPGSSFDESLYRLPRLPAEYESLEKLIDALLSSGAEYAAPTSGSNLQSVQMVDLNGDGEEEAVAFMRRAGDERPMKVFVFRAVGDSYEQYCVIEGTSSSIYSINYTDLNGDGWREILAGIRSDLDVQNLAVYSVASGEPQQLLVTGYSRYVSQDIDGDALPDLIVLRSDEESMAVADYYAWDGAELALHSSLRLSGTVAELSRFTTGTLADGRKALFVTSVGEDSSGVTDIMLAEGGLLHSVKNGASLERVRFLDVYPGDVNGDGVTEVPEAVPFPQTDAEGTTYYLIRWRQYDSTGESSIVRETYQDTQGGWSLAIGDGWEENVTVSRSVSADGSSVTFTRIDGLEPVPFLTVHAFTGYNR
ncbi:MAG: VCBS repeat-containing protein, partial [Oscillospiraceae bacterium]|nr:VCBS repeat-containing protein [Oscillospiraceae bacterium]